MRHRVRNNHLSRTSAHRKALLSHLASDLIRNKRIETTLAKAKALRVYVEPLITKSKTNTTHNRRLAFRSLQDKEVVSELFGEVSAKVGNRPGGYTRIIKLGSRLGDAAEMALIELVDFNEVYSNTEEDKPKRKRTRRSGARKNTATKETAENTNNTKEEKVDTAEEPTTNEAKSEEKPEKEATPPPAEEKKDEANPQTENPSDSDAENSKKSEE